MSVYTPLIHWPPSATIPTPAAPATNDTPQTLAALLQPNPFVLSAPRVNAYCKFMNITVEQLLQDLIPSAKEFARPPISNYHVGVAGLGMSGAVYLGVNL